MKLFLLKDAKNTLCIDEVASHQIDGIRFLYRQFKKKNPGVILDRCNKDENRTQVCLFLKGIKPLLRKPILVICPKDSIDKWREHFLDCADDENDIAVESSSIFTKHRVFINTIEDVGALCRATWSVVIIESNDFHITRILNFKTDFKIWVTSVNIEAHLDVFPLVYHWLNPEEKNNIQELTQEGNGLKDEIAKLIVLEAFLDDIVFGSNNLSTPLKNAKTEENHDEENFEETRKRSNKCKDITGKKVKRSKKRVIENDGQVDFPASVQNNSAVNVPKVTASRNNDSFEYFNFRNEKNNEVTKNNEMDVETFIRVQEPIKAAQSNDNANNDLSQTESNTIDFLNAVNEIVNNENNYQSRDNNGSPSLFDNVEDNKMEVEHPNVLKKIKTNDKTSSICKGNFKTPADNDVDLTIKKEEDFFLNIRGKNVNVKRENGEEILVNNAKTFDYVANSGCEISISRNEKVNIKEEETNLNKVQKIVQESVKKETESKPDAKKDITEQISDLEKDALNRFKGSILDTLFKLK